MTPRSSNNKPNGDITRVAVVTGSSSGIGFETALALAINGFILMLQCVILKNLQVSKR
jgi:NADP-dependent 3-hydroxy acid dehydrogenase YdfG